VQRQLYPALLLTTIALAAAVYMRPTVGQELMGLAGVWGRRNTPNYASGTLNHVDPGATAESAIAPVGVHDQSRGSIWHAPSLTRPEEPAGEAFAGVGYPLAGAAELPAAAPSGDSSPQQGFRRGAEVVQVAAEMPVWPDRSRARQPPSGPARPSYPIAGTPGDYRPVGQTTAPRYPTAGTAQNWDGRQPVGPYPVAGSAPAGVYPDQPVSVPYGQNRFGEQPPPATRYTTVDPAEAPRGFAQPTQYANQPVNSVGPSNVPLNGGPSYVTQPASPGARATGIMPVPPVARSPATTEARLYEGAQPLAKVGNQVILASEVMPAVDEMLARIPQDELAQFSERQLEIQKKALIWKLLQSHIETKLIYEDAQRTIEAERLTEIEKHISEHFDKEELPKRIEKAQVGSRRELDEKLRGMGTSLERVKRAYVQRSVAVQWMRQQNQPDPDVSYDDMLDYYREHLTDFETPARARWETMSVRIPRYTDGREAYAKLADMGNAVMDGASMDDVLKAQAGGELECRGGQTDWTTKGDLGVSDAIEAAVFGPPGLPVGRLSQIFRDGGAWHIVRVLEREEAKRTPFEEAQVEIREKIRELRREQQVQEYLARLKEQIPVWTVLDDDAEVARLRRQADPSTK